MSDTVNKSNNSLVFVPIVAKPLTFQYDNEDFFPMGIAKVKKTNIQNPHESDQDIEEPVSSPQHIPISFNSNPENRKFSEEVYQTSDRLTQFNQLYDEVEKEMPEARQYRRLLTKIAQNESRFNFGIQNTAGAPAYGYFQFWQDGKVNNVSYYSGLSVNDFLKNPKEQIKAAVRMAYNIQRKLTKEDVDKAKNMGISISGLIGGAWLGGLNGVRKVLNGTGNPSDSKWYGGKGGDNVANCLQKYNNLM